MKSLRCFSAGTQSVNLGQGILNSISKALLCLLCAVFCGMYPTQKLAAQAPPVVWTNLGDFSVGYQLSTSADSLPAYEQFYINLYLDVPSDTSCMGVEFILDYSSEVEPAESPSLSVPPGSWLGTAAELNLGETLVAGSDRVLYTATRIDGSLDYGKGQVLTAEFLVGGEPVATADLVASLDGGLIMIENVDMKQGIREEKSPRWTAYPNPFRDKIRLAGNIQEIARIRAMSMGGVVMKQGTPNGQGEFDLHDLPPGLVLLEVMEDNGELTVIKLLKQ